MPKPYILLTVGTILIVIGFAIPGSFPGTFFFALLVALWLGQD